MPAILPVQDEAVNLTAPFAAGPATSGTFGSAILGPAGTVAAPESARAPGDYLTRFAAKTLSTSRELLYVVPEGTRAVIRYALLTNGSAAARTVELWLGGRLAEPGISLAAAEAKSDELTWIALPGEKLEGRASGVGVGCLITGVEEVG